MRNASRRTMFREVRHRFPSNTPGIEDGLSDMNITISPLAATEVEAVVEDRGVRYPSLRLDVWVALTALSDPGHQAMHWGNDLAGGDDFDSLAEHLACLYDECEILPRPERAVAMSTPPCSGRSGVRTGCRRHGIGSRICPVRVSELSSDERRRATALG